MQAAAFDQFVWLKVVMFGGLAAFAIFLLCMPLGALIGKRRGRHALRGTLLIYAVSIVVALVWANSSGELVSFGNGPGFEVAFQMGMFLLIGLFTAYTFAARFLDDPDVGKARRADAGEERNEDA